MRKLDPTALSAAVLTAACVAFSTCNHLPVPGRAQPEQVLPVVSTTPLLPRVD